MEKLGAFLFDAEWMQCISRLVALLYAVVGIYLSQAKDESTAKLKQERAQLQAELDARINSNRDLAARIMVLKDSEWVARVMKLSEPAPDPTLIPELMYGWDPADSALRRELAAQIRGMLGLREKSP